MAIYPQPFTNAPGFLYVAMALAAASLFVLLATPKWSYLPVGGVDRS